MCRGGTAEIDAPSIFVTAPIHILQPDCELTLEEQTWLDATIELELSGRSDPQNSPSVDVEDTGSTPTGIASDDAHATSMDLGTPVSTTATAMVLHGLSANRTIDAPSQNQVSTLPPSSPNSQISPTAQVNVMYNTGRARVIPRHPITSESTFTPTLQGVNNINQDNTATMTTPSPLSMNANTTPPVTPTRSRSLRRTTHLLPPLSPSSSSTAAAGKDAIGGAAGLEDACIRSRPRPRPLDILKETTYENEDDNNDSNKLGYSYRSGSLRCHRGRLPSTPLTSTSTSSDSSASNPGRVGVTKEVDVSGPPLGNSASGSDVHQHSALNAFTRGSHCTPNSDSGSSSGHSHGHDSANLIAVEIPSSPLHRPSLVLLSSPTTVPSHSPEPTRSSATVSSSIITNNPYSPSEIPSRGSARTLRHPVIATTTAAAAMPFTTTSITTSSSSPTGSTAQAPVPPAMNGPSIPSRGSLLSRPLVPGISTVPSTPIMSPTLPTVSAEPMTPQRTPSNVHPPAQIQLPTPPQTPTPKSKIPNAQSQWIYRQVKPLPRSWASISGPAIGEGTGHDIATDLLAITNAAGQISSKENGNSVSLIGAGGRSSFSAISTAPRFASQLQSRRATMTMLPQHSRSQSQHVTPIFPRAPAVSAQSPSSGSSAESSSATSSSSFLTIGAETATESSACSSVMPPTSSLPDLPSTPSSTPPFWTSFLKPRYSPGSRSRSYSERSLRPLISLKGKFFMSTISGSFSASNQALASDGSGNCTITPSANASVVTPTATSNPPIKPNISGPIGISSSNGLIGFSMPGSETSCLLKTNESTNLVPTSARTSAGVSMGIEAREREMEAEAETSGTPTVASSSPSTDDVLPGQIRTTSVSSVDSSGLTSNHATQSAKSASSGTQSQLSYIIRPSPKQERKPYKSCLSIPSQALAPTTSQPPSACTTIGAPAMTGLSKVVSASTASRSTATSATTTRTSSSAGSVAGGTTNKSVKFADMPTVHYTRKIYWDFDPRELGIIRNGKREGCDRDDDEVDEEYYEDAADDGATAKARDEQEGESDQMDVSLDIDEVLDTDQAVGGNGGRSRAASKPSSGSEPDEMSFAQDVFGSVISAQPQESVANVSTNRTLEFEQDKVIADAAHPGSSLSKSGSITSSNTVSPSPSSAAKAAASGLKRIISLNRKSSPPSSCPSSESIPKRRRRLAISSRSSQVLDGDVTKTRPMISGPFALGSVPMALSTPPASREENFKWKLTPSRRQQEHRRRYHHTHQQSSTSSVVSVPVLPSSASTSSLRRRRVPRSSLTSLRHAHRSPSFVSSGSGSSTPNDSTMNTIGFPLRTMPSLDSFQSGKSAATRSVKSLPGSVKSTTSTGKFRVWLGKFGIGSGSTQTIAGAALEIGSGRAIAVNGDTGV